MKNAPGKIDVTAGGLRPCEGGPDAAFLLRARLTALPLLIALPALAQDEDAPASAMITVTAPPSELRVRSLGVCWALMR